MNSLKELNIFDEGNKIFVYGITNNLVSRYWNSQIFIISCKSNKGDYNSHK